MILYAARVSPLPNGMVKIPSKCIGDAKQLKPTKAANRVLHVTPVGDAPSIPKWMKGG
jgi:hypothetical protein